MQRAKFINPMGAAVVFHRGPYVFEKISGIGAADAAMVTSDPASVDGKAYAGCYTDDREITVTCSIEGATRLAMYKAKQDLIAALAPWMYKDGVLGRFEYTNDNFTTWIPAAVKKGPQGTTRAGNFLKSEQLVFYCPNPYWRGMTYDRAQLAYLGGGLKFPVQFGAVRFGAVGYKNSIWSKGDSPSPLEAWITGPAEAPAITKVSTGEYIRLRDSKPLYEGDVLYISTMPGSPSVTITRADGTTEDAIGYIDLTGTFYQLDPGENVMQYTSGDDSQTTRVELATLPWWGGR